MGEHQGFYYLHKDGSLIFKPAAVAQSIYDSYFDSSFVKKVWDHDLSDRLCAWRIVLEGFFYGAKVDRLIELAERWKLTFEDSIELLKRTQPKDITEGMKGGLPSFVAHVLKVTPDEYWSKVRMVLANEKGVANA
jgi:hypothetical protein